MKPVIILGRAHIWNGSPKMDFVGKEVWALNAGAMKGNVCHVAFQMHEESEFIGLNPNPNDAKRYDTWLRELTIPVYMNRHRPEYPTSIAYPFDDIWAMLGHIKQGIKKFQPLKFLTSSFDFAMALAILKEAPEVNVYGFEMAVGTEYEKQRTGMTFWIGFAGGRNIPLNIHCADGIFKKPIYGQKEEHANV